MSKELSESQNSIQVKKKAILLLCLIVLLCLFSILFLLFHHGISKNGYTAYLYQDGNLVETIDLSTLNGPKTALFSDENGGFNQILFDKNSVSITDANCPEKLCVHMGKIQNDSLPLVCLPHKLVIVLKENNKKVDGITY